MKKVMVDYGYQYYMDLSSSCMELEGGQEVWTSPWKFKTFYIPIPPTRPLRRKQNFILVDSCMQFKKERPDDHYCSVRCMVHTPWHSVVEADFKHVILLSCESKLSFLGIILLIENMALGICHLIGI